MCYYKGEAITISRADGIVTATCETKEGTVKVQVDSKDYSSDTCQLETAIYKNSKRNCAPTSVVVEALKQAGLLVRKRGGWVLEESLVIQSSEVRLAS